jgi:hypothetical protein
MPQQVTDREWEVPVYEEKPSRLEKPSKISLDCSSSSDDAPNTKWDSERKTIKRSKKAKCLQGQEQLKKTPQEHLSDHSIHKMDESREEDGSKNAADQLHSGPEKTKKAQIDKNPDPDCFEKNSNACDMQLSPGVEHKDADSGYHISKTDVSTDHSHKVNETHQNESKMCRDQKPVNDTSTSFSSQSKGDHKKSTKVQLIELIDDSDSDEDLVVDPTPPQSVCEKGNSPPSKIVTQTFSLDNLAKHSKVSNGEAKLRQVVHGSCVSTSKHEKDLKPTRRDIEFDANKRAADVKKDSNENDKSIPVMGNLESEGVPESSNPTICAVDQNAISQLINMGFTKEDSTRSYIDAGRDLEVAVAMMLSGQHS